MDNESFDVLLEYLPLLIPILLIQLALVVAALWDLIRREKTRGPKWLWVIIILLLNFIGPIVYFVVGRDDE
ncbi:MAG TPA: PLD nuclease N-terminal domain-containing protein [candidate division Zixibacteria bacterium]|nr:PLD nuclease N-terminal domain-containing protein [candidate division Zixibacteria bacterium]